MRRSEVRALLDKARATLECPVRGRELGFPDHPAVEACQAVEFTISNDPHNPYAWHSSAASITLDGLSVDDVTAVGG